MTTAARIAPVLVAALLFGACTPERPAPQRHEIVMEQLAFSPASLTVNQGDTIVFINNDIVPHTATDTLDAHWDTGAVVHGAQATIVVQEKGVNHYFCSFHPTMTGEITVQ